MPRRPIHVLPESVQNKIAAGEVIERPASVVKELAENAIDAGATLVAVDLEDGGHRLVRVSDDGAGMGEDDLIACVQRHATSKIESVEDIFAITSFGFRGEALPSIASVSRLAIATCLPGAAEGHELVVEAGKMLRIAPAAPRKGTRVEVRDIFFNTPARRKFLSQPTSENTRAGDILTRLALGNPGVGFRLQTNDRLVLSVRPAAGQRERIADLFSNDFGRDGGSRLVAFRNDITDGLAVDGFFSRPPATRRTSKDIYILVNGRWIRHYGIVKAVGDAFQGILPPREYPFAVINITVDPARVDVNAHPTKEEVRFEQSAILVSGVKRAIREALAGVAAQPTIVSLGGAEGAAFPGPPVPPRAEAPAAGRIDEQRRIAYPSRPFQRSDLAGVDLDAVRERLRRPTAPGGPESTPPPPVRRPAGGEPPLRPGAAGPAATPPSDADDNGGFSVGFRLLGQVAGRYIILHDPEGVIFIDPHALHERWNFDRLVEERRRGTQASRLLIPLDMRLSPGEAAAADEAAPALAEYGFEIIFPDREALRVLAAPDFIAPEKLEPLLRQVLADVGDVSGTVEQAREKLLASLACRSSVLLGHALPEEEIETLLDRFFSKGQMPTCPHGRPTAIRISWEELARRFKR